MRELHNFKNLFNLVLYVGISVIYLVMHKSAQMNFPPTPIFGFTCSVARTTDEVDNPRCISSHGEFLGVLSSDCSILQSTQRSPTREQCGTITTLYLVTIDIKILGVVDKYIYLLLF